MPTAVRIVIAVLTTIGFGLSISWCAASFGWESPAFAALASRCVIVYVAVSSVAVHWTLPAGIYQLRSWESGGAVYKRLVERMLEFYDEEAVFVAQDGKVISGLEDLRAACIASAPGTLRAASAPSHHSGGVCR